MGQISFGAMGAAVIAAIASFVGLILAKEQKTSEFRQNWIDSLRAEITTYLSSIAAISDQLCNAYENNEAKLKALIPFYAALNGASISIKLRINPTETKSKAVLCAMEKFEILSKSDAKFSSIEIEAIEKEMLLASQLLLKSEWKRVKKGEPIYRFAKWSALVLAIILSAILIYSAVSQSSLKTAPPAKSDAVQKRVTTGTPNAKILAKPDNSPPRAVAADRP